MGSMIDRVKHDFTSLGAATVNRRLISPRAKAEPHSTAQNQSLPIHCSNFVVRNSP